MGLLGELLGSVLYHKKMSYQNASFLLFLSVVSDRLIIEQTFHPHFLVHLKFKKGALGGA